MAKKKPGSERWGDIKGGMAFIVPVALTRHECWKLLSPWGHKLIADLSTQYTGYNNGYLCAAWTLMQHRGWRSRTTLDKAAAELEHYQIIERTQQGGRNRPNLYAFTFRRVDRLEGRPLDVGMRSVPTNAWDSPVTPFKGEPKNKNACPSGGPIGRGQAHEVGNACPSNGLRTEH